MIAAAIAALLLAPAGARAEVSEITIPLGAGGFGFLPFDLMQKHQLVEKAAAKAGITLKVNWLKTGGASVVNDALLSGSANFIAAGPPSFLLLWDRTLSNAKVKGIAAMSSMPEYLNTTAEHLKTLDDIKPGDKISLNAVKVSIPAIIMQMYAAKKYGPKETFRFDPYTVSMKHADAVIAIVSGNKQITADWASPPFHQRELSAKGVRTVMTTDDVMGGSTTFTMISTTTKFHDANPKICAALLSALKDAMAMIKADKKGSAAVLLESMGGKGYTIDELVKMLDQPDIKYTTTPENVMKYVNFMLKTGSIKVKPDSWKDLFFPNAHNLSGS
jgi:NitT/TauT family transport system substrate-binding protein